MITAIGPFVRGIGPLPCRIMLVGEGPGPTEAYEGVPFVGESGQEQDTWLVRNGLHRRRIYITNLIKCHIPGNGDPTPDDIASFEPLLYEEIAECRPEFIIAVGRFAARWFLGDDTDMDAVHGMPQRSIKAPGATIIPVYHPALGLYDPDMKGVIFADYKAASDIIHGKVSREPIFDQFPDPVYTEPDDWGTEFEFIAPEVVAVDTEGVPGAEWGFSISTEPGIGLVARRANPNFPSLVESFLAYLQDKRPLVVFHNAMYDLEMLRGLGVDVVSSGAPIYDTMVAAYLLRTEAQGLKPLAKRFCGMAMRTYEEVIGDAADSKRRSYLESVVRGDWPSVESRVVVENDLTSRVYTPKRVAAMAAAILSDWEKAKANQEGGLGFVTKAGNKEEFDPVKRWKGVDKVQRRHVESALGSFPDATLDDIDTVDAVHYSGRDPDATLRLYQTIEPKLRRLGLTERHSLIMTNLPSIEEMQATGLLADRAHFEALSERMWNRMGALCTQLSVKFNGSRPINPASGDQVAALMRRRGLVGLKRSKKTKKMSTSKKSIEHLRHEDDAMSAVINWREHQKIRDSFCTPIIDRIPDGQARSRVRCTIRVTRVSSSRLSATNPPLLAIPVRHELGLDVRRGFVAAPGHLLGTWDLSQIEMRVMAHLSRDPLLCRLFREGRDIHAETAIQIFHINSKGEKDEKGKWVYPGVKKMEHRNPTKRAGFGVITGIQGMGLLDQLRMMGCEGWDEDSCDHLIIEWFKVYKGVDRFLGDCRAECRDKGFVRDMGGMYRYLPGVWSHRSAARAEAERQSHSHIIQGSAQWMIQRAMAWLRPQIEGLRGGSGAYIKWLLQIHDELIFEFDDYLWEFMNHVVTDALTNHSYKLSVPVEANGACALTWGDLEK